MSDNKKLIQAKQFIDKAIECENKQKVSDAFDNFRKAAKLGDAQAQYRLGCYHMGNFGSVIESWSDKSRQFRKKKGDRKRAHKWLTRAADQNHGDAVAVFGIRHYKDGDCDYLSPKRVSCISRLILTDSSIDTGYALLNRAVGLNSALAKYYLARYHYQCVERVNFNTHGASLDKGMQDDRLSKLNTTEFVANTDTCFQLLKESSESGHIKSIYYYGLMCKQRGMPKEAFDSFRVASEKGGLYLATIELANCHYTGYYTNMDVEKAFQLLLSCKSNDRAMKGGLLLYQIIRMYDKLPPSSSSLQLDGIDVAALRLLGMSSKSYYSYFGGGGITLSQVLDSRTQLAQKDFSTVQNIREKLTDYSFNRGFKSEYYFLHRAFYALCYLNRFSAVTRNDPLFNDSTKRFKKVFKHLYITNQFFPERTVPIEYLCDLAHAYITNIDAQQAEDTLHRAMSCHIPEAFYMYALTDLPPTSNTTKRLKALEQAHEMRHPLAYRHFYYDIMGRSSTSSSSSSSPSFTESFQYVLKVALETRSSFAQVDLGTCYRDGLGVLKDLELASQYYIMSAQQGNPEAKYLLAMMLPLNQPDEKKRFLKESLDGGYILASIQLAETQTDQIQKAKSLYQQLNNSINMTNEKFDLLKRYGCIQHVHHIMALLAYQVALSTTDNVSEEAFKWFKKSKGAEHRSSGQRELSIASYYATKQNFKNSKSKSEKWFTKTYNINPQLKEVKLTVSMMKWEKLRKSPDSQDKKQVFGELLELAKEGIVEAALQVTKEIVQGLYTDHSASGSDILGYAKLAAKEKQVAYVLVATILFKGMGVGVVKDLAGAYEWYTKSAQECNDAESYYMLGEYHQHGYLGIGSNIDKAFTFYELAASSNDHSLACYNLALIYMYGKGKQSINLEKAIGYFEKSHPLESLEFGQCLLHYNSTLTSTANEQTIKVFERSLKILEKVNGLKPELKLIGQEYYKFGVWLQDIQCDDTKAMEYFEKGLATGHDHLDTIQQLAASYLRNSRAEDALLLFRKAYEKYNSEVAVKSIFYIHLEGLVKTTDKIQLYKWAERAAMMCSGGACPSAMIYIATNENGQGVRMQQDKAIEWLTKANTGESLYHIANIHSHDNGDKKLALKYYLDAFDSGYEAVSCIIAEYYHRGHVDKVEIEKAIKYYKIAADNINGGGGDKESSFQVAMLLKDQNNNNKLCYHYFVKAMPLEKASYQIGLALLHGYYGVDVDYKKAIKHIQQAVDHGIVSKIEALPLLEIASQKLKELEKKKEEQRKVQEEQRREQERKDKIKEQKRQRKEQEKRKQQEEKDRIVNRYKQHSSNLFNTKELDLIFSTETATSEIDNLCKRAVDHFWVCKSATYCSVNHEQTLTTLSEKFDNHQVHKALGEMHRGHNGHSKDLQNAKYHHALAANGGIVDSMYYLALVLLELNQDSDAAKRWMEKACKMLNVDAMMWMADQHANGTNGYLVDESKAIDLYTTATKTKSNPKADSYLFGRYFHGQGCEKNHIKAFKYLNRNSHLQDEQGMIDLGDCYQNGIGTEKDYNLAMQFYQRVLDANPNTAFKGHIFNQIGCIYYAGGGSNYQQDFHKAKDYFEKSLATGYNPKTVQDNINNSQNQINNHIQQQQQQQQQQRYQQQQQQQQQQQRQQQQQQQQRYQQQQQKQMNNMMHQAGHAMGDMTENYVNYTNNINNSMASGNYDNILNDTVQYNMDQNNEMNKFIQRGYKNMNSNQNAQNMFRTANALNNAMYNNFQQQFNNNNNSFFNK
ncbi:hypothetical protein DFA_09690 [Cavenderia fasciculata]|uniref:Uncharacterized protein n=1 Tax=Cavenderia fasciculata TaxID=261658 RepID=F4Q8B8_CACFS|nr:uncharacterized protein DFA_09690 [Cavenderia fasciculata]EGG16018.1 hypothetical protein DFA_09690 [Cavenderia fasciculata]|eukprot:XP_004352343.1 hypothetical protein DFA_09690 [Cavenderia fasciculata]